MMWWHDGMNWGGWVAMTVMMVAFWAVVIFGLIAVLGRTGERSRTPQLDPQNILRERFARGEIDADEYHARQETLRTHK